MWMYTPEFYLCANAIIIIVLAITCYVQNERAKK